MVIAAVTAVCSVVTMITLPEFKIQFGVVIISGASTGIGRHAAETLASEGYFVYAGVRKQKDYDAMIALDNPLLKPLMFDVTNHDSCVTAMSQVAATLDERKVPLVALVNNAGVSRRKTAEFHDVADAKTVFETNFFGMLDLTQLALPLLRKHQGRIVMVSSVAGVFGSPLSSIYSASKFAMEGFADSLRRELRPHNVAVSIVQPAFVKSAIFDKTIKMNAEIFADDAVKDEIISIYPNLYSEKSRAKRANGIEGADQPTVTSDAIFDAIRSKRPLTRYPVANFNGIPAFVIVQLVRILPDYVLDYVFTVV